MLFSKKVAVGINLNDPQTEILKGIRQLEFLNHSEVHFVTINMTTSYTIGLGESSIVYPLIDDQKKIREATISALNQLTSTLLGQNFKGKIIFECIFSDDPKRKFCDYVEDSGIDTIVLASREKKGFFESSFTNYVNKHSRANLIVLKHKV
jgi:hypothetical protein